MKITRKKALFSLFFLGNFLFFPLAIAETSQCRFLEDTVKSDGIGISFFDRRALLFFQNEQLEDGESKIFLERNRDRLSEECLL